MFFSVLQCSELQSIINMYSRKEQYLLYDLVKVFDEIKNSLKSDFSFLF